jgi:hypothetical protein
MFFKIKIIKKNMNSFYFFIRNEFEYLSNDSIENIIKIIKKKYENNKTSIENIYKLFYIYNKYLIHIDFLINYYNNDESEIYFFEKNYKINNNQRDLFLSEEGLYSYYPIFCYEINNKNCNNNFCLFAHNENEIKFHPMNFYLNEKYFNDEHIKNFLNEMKKYFNDFVIENNNKIIENEIVLNENEKNIVKYKILRYLIIKILKCPICKQIPNKMEFFYLSCCKKTVCSKCFKHFNKFSSFCPLCKQIHNFNKIEYSNKTFNEIIVN